MRSLVVAAIIVLIAMTCLAQDPTRVAPQAYRLDFENEWVRVMRVHYAPHEKIPAHDHTRTASAYVYLNDSEPVIFKHIGLQYGAITRPATKAGSFRLFRAVKEVHEVENTGSTPSDFLRVEFKTEPVNEQSLRGRFFREDYPAGQNYAKVQFENEQIRVTRLVCAAGKKLDVSSSEEPALLMSFSPAEFKVTGSNVARNRLSLAPGKTEWIPAKQQRVLENTGAAAVELLRFDFKTRPARANSAEVGK